MYCKQSELLLTLAKFKLKKKSHTMKKVLLFAIFGLLSVSAYSQHSTVTLTSSGSITNSGTAYVITPSTGVLRYAYPTTTVYVSIAKTSGTVGGNCVLQGSADGVSFTNISTDSLSLTNVTTQGKTWVISNDGYKYKRVFCTGSGTMVAVPTGGEQRWLSPTATYPQE